MSKLDLDSDAGDSIVNKILFQALCDFKVQFSDYLKEENKKVDSNARKEFLDSIVDAIYSKDERPSHYLITNFNYTSIGTYIEYNIHGKLDSDIVIGYDSSAKLIGKKDIFELSKEWQKLVYPPTFSLAYAHVDSLIFYGHSIGEQDYPYFFNIFEKCGITHPNCEVILYFCYSEFKESNCWNSFDKYKMNVTKMINEFERSIDPNILRNKLLTKLFDSGRLVFLKI